MTRFIGTVLAGFILGAPASPWGLARDLHPALAVVAVVLGSLACAGLVIFTAERIRPRWHAWRRRNPTRRAPGLGRTPGGTSRRARRLFDKLGAPGFGLVGTLIFGTWGTAALGAAMGLPKRRLLTWLAVGVTVWSTVFLTITQVASSAGD
ncbi:hypothetical protein ACH5A3_17725 [Streptomyces echinatus]|uniref:hypothetical protein n=1 Tax=Streptomyces echinatus TaxID=67293 RepID=UPI00379EF243